MTSPALRVATYNIHKGVLGLGARRMTIYTQRRAVSSLHADLIFLQEVLGEHRKFAARFSDWPTAPQHEVLAQDLGYHTAYQRNAVTRHGDHGNALLSRWPIHSVAHRDISDHRFEQRGLLHVAVGHPTGTVHCIVVHLGLLAKSRLRQSQQLAQYIRAEVPVDEPLIVAGDFNDWQGHLGPDLSGLNVMEALHPAAPAPRSPVWWQRLKAGKGHAVTSGQAVESVAPSPRLRTFPARFPLVCLDRIYTRGFSVHHVQAFWGPGWAQVSDHAPYVADLVLDSVPANG